MDSIHRILIPTDFSIASLNLVKEAVEQTGDYKLDIILVYGVHLSSSISELLFFSKPKLLSTLQSREFADACSLLKNKYLTKVHSIYPDLLVSNSTGYMKQYLEQEQIDQVYIPAHYKLAVPNKKYFDPSAALSKVSTDLQNLNWPGSAEIPYPLTNHISDLFLPG